MPAVSHPACGFVNAQHDPVGVQGRAALVCLAAAFVATSFGTDRKDRAVPRTRLFCGLTLLFFYSCFGTLHQAFPAPVRFLP